MSHNAEDSNPDLPGLGELITLQEAAELSELSVSHLRLLVRRGDIWGVKLGHNWLTTTQAVQKYLAQDRRRTGPTTDQEGLGRARSSLPRHLRWAFRELGGCAGGDRPTAQGQQAV